VTNYLSRASLRDVICFRDALLDGPEEIEGGPDSVNLGFDESEETHGFRRLFGDFFGGKKVTQPVEAVGHNNRHAFIGILN
jgi:hypothetical protein